MTFTTGDNKQALLDALRSRQARIEELEARLEAKELELEKCRADYRRLEAVYHDLFNARYSSYTPNPTLIKCDT